MVIHEKIYVEAYINSLSKHDILYNCIIIETVDLNYRFFPVFIGLSVILTDLQQCTWLKPTSFWKICQYQKRVILSQMSDMSYVQAGSKCCNVIEIIAMCRTEGPSYLRLDNCKERFLSY